MTAIFSQLSACAMDALDDSGEAGAISPRLLLERLFVETEQHLTNVLYRVLWDQHEVADVVQDTFVRIWNKRASVDWPRARGLVFRIGLDLARNRRRALRIRARLLPVDAVQEPSPADELMQRTKEAAVQRAIESLPSKLRDALLLCTYSDLDYAQIAETLGIAIGTVGSRRNEALARVRKQLGEQR